MITPTVCKVNNKNINGNWSGVFIVNFENIKNIFQRINLLFLR